MDFTVFVACGQTMGKNSFRISGSVIATNFKRSYFNFYRNHSEYYLGLPDKSFLGLSEIFHSTLRIAQAVRIPIIVDCDDGYGNALHVIRAVRDMERIGVACLCIQDKDPRSGRLAPGNEMEKKIRAAIDTRRDILLMARTDAFAVHGIEETIVRARRYAAAGADIGFPPVEMPGARDFLSDGDRLEIDSENGVLRNVTTEAVRNFEPYSPFFQRIVAAGGIINTLRNQ